MFPKRMRLKNVLGLMLIVSAPVLALTNDYAPDSTAQAVYRIADRLVDEQVTSGFYTGVWPAIGGATAGSFAGTMSAGLSEAYWMTCETAYKTAAENAGTWILNNAPGCSLYYDEAYTLMELSEINCDPSNNVWRTALEDFYGCVESQPPDPAYDYKEGTEWFIAVIEDVLAPGFATLEVAYYTVAAYYIDTPDKAIWRSELIRLLETCDDEANPQQVLALGVATWALALTGDLDATAIDVGSAGWTRFPGGKADTLQELPSLLKTYQVPHDQVYYHDHFCSVFNPPLEAWYGLSGWTETNIFAIMGLDAAAETDSSYDFRTTIDETWAVTMQPVDFNGDVWWDAIELPNSGDNEAYYHYAGEYLQYLAAARLPGDINLDDSVDILDVQVMGLNWLGISGCQCSIADLNRDHQVNLLDFARLAEGWLLSRPTAD